MKWANINLLFFLAIFQNLVEILHFSKKSLKIHLKCGKIGLKWPIFTYFWLFFDDFWPIWKKNGQSLDLPWLIWDFSRVYKKMLYSLTSFALLFYVSLYIFLSPNKKKCGCVRVVSKRILCHISYLPKF